METCSLTNLLSVDLVTFELNDFRSHVAGGTGVAFGTRLVWDCSPTNRQTEVRFAVDVRSCSMIGRTDLCG
mgnify:CR=1 FL=1